MKKTLLFLLITMMLSTLTSCTEQYYQLYNNASYPLSGSICEYDSYNRCINITSFHLDVRQSTPVIMASDESTKVKIFLNGYNKWVGDVYYLNTINTILITLDNYTYLVDYEPQK